MAAMMAPAVENATNPLLLGPDWANNMECVDLVNNDQLGGAKEAARALRKRLMHQDVHVQMLTATLLEALVKNFGAEMRAHVATPEFMRAITKFVTSERTSRTVRAQLAVLVHDWAAAYPEISAFGETSATLRAQGVLCPPDDGVAQADLPQARGLAGAAPTLPSSTRGPATHDAGAGIAAVPELPLPPPDSPGPRGTLDAESRSDLADPLGSDVDSEEEEQLQLALEASLVESAPNGLGVGTNDGNDDNDDALALTYEKGGTDRLMRVLALLIDRTSLVSQCVAAAVSASDAASDEARRDAAAGIGAEIIAEIHDRFAAPRRSSRSFSLA